MFNAYTNLIEVEQETRQSYSRKGGTFFGHGVGSLLVEFEDPAKVSAIALLQPLVYICGTI